MLRGHILARTFLGDCRNKFSKHRTQAGQRGVPFLMTFDEWMEIWMDSGHWHERGLKRGQYVMARFGDKGPYSIDNVRIILGIENTKEGHCGKIRPESTRQKISDKAKGNKRWLGKKHSDETKRKQSDARKKYFMSDENR